MIIVYMIELIKTKSRVKASMAQVHGLDVSKSTTGVSNLKDSLSHQAAGIAAGFSPSKKILVNKPMIAMGRSGRGDLAVYLGII
jgi:hypothetical protein